MIEKNLDFRGLRVSGIYWFGLSMSMRYHPKLKILLNIPYQSATTYRDMIFAIALS